MRGVNRFSCALLAALSFAVVLADLAWAHGGRFAGPGGRAAPRDPVRPPIRPRPPGAPPGPLTPGTSVPVTPRPTPGSGIPTTSGPLADTDWGTWWALNRWAYLPERGAAMRKGRVVTGPERPDLRRAMDRKRRALLARQYIKPFLLKQLDAKGEDRDSVRAAALLALAKISADDETLERILKTAEGGRPGAQERESAALAVGLLRRTDPALRLSPSSLDRARTRLLALLGSKRQAVRGRCYAAFSLGLLADQGYGSAETEHGKVVVQGLTARLQGRYGGPELLIALLTALSMQPREAVPSELFDELRAAVVGSRVFGRRWLPLEQGHALSAYARLEGPGWVTLLLRSLSDRRIAAPVKRTACLALGSEAERLSPEERLQVVEGLYAAARTSKDPLSEGVGQIAMGRVLNAELRDGCLTILEKTKAADLLLRGATKGRLSIRGFHVLALALAAREVAAKDTQIQEFVAAARKTMLAGFDRPRGDADLKSSYVVGIGLLRAAAAKDRLVKVLVKRKGGPVLGGRTAIALAALEAADEDVLKALRAIAADKSAVAPRSEAALALSILTGVPASDLLIEQLRAAKSLRQQTSAAVTLGQLDDPKALSAIIQVANKRDKNDELRALAIAVLGLLGDPEDHPSLFRLSLDANYIARTDALHEAFQLL